MEKQIRELIKRYKDEQRKNIQYRRIDIRKREWLDVIHSEATESFYHMMITDLNELLKAATKKNKSCTRKQ